MAMARQWTRTWPNNFPRRFSPSKVPATLVTAIDLTSDQKICFREWGSDRRIGVKAWPSSPLVFRPLRRAPRSYRWRLGSVECPGFISRRLIPELPGFWVGFFLDLSQGRKVWVSLPVRRACDLCRVLNRPPTTSSAWVVFWKGSGKGSASPGHWDREPHQKWLVDNPQMSTEGSIEIPSPPIGFCRCVESVPHLARAWYCRCHASQESRSGGSSEFQDQPIKRSCEFAFARGAPSKGQNCAQENQNRGSSNTFRPNMARCAPHKLRMFFGTSATGRAIAGCWWRAEGIRFAGDFPQLKGHKGHSCVGANPPANFPVKRRRPLKIQASRRDSFHFCTFGFLEMAQVGSLWGYFFPGFFGLPIVRRFGEVIISSLRGNWHSLTDYAECLVLTFSCFVFGHESEAGRSGGLGI